MKIENKVEIGKNIRALRKEKKLTQSELANLLYVSQDTISLWELDKSLPDIPSLVCMSQIFNVTTDYLLNLE